MPFGWCLPSLAVSATMLGVELADRPEPRLSAELRLRLASELVLAHGEVPRPALGLAHAPRGVAEDPLIVRPDRIVYAVAPTGLDLPTPTRTRATPA